MAKGNGHPQSGLELGYARVTTTKQSFERQLDALAVAGIPDMRIYTDGSIPTRRPAPPSSATASTSCSATPGPATRSWCTPWTGSAATSARC
jgi:hypothetical protein